MGVLHLTPTKYSPILVGSEIMPSAELCIYIVISSVESGLLSYMEG